jgi:hypothetical protein
MAYIVSSWDRLNLSSQSTCFEPPSMIYYVSIYRMHADYCLSFLFYMTEAFLRVLTL